MDRRPTTQDISWFLDLDRNKQLDLEPPYQRRSVWSLRDRRYFLDTIFRGYPSPAVFLHKRFIEGDKSVYEVVDGKQRLETILMFVSNKIAVEKEFGDGALNGRRWSELAQEYQRRFWDYVIPVEFIKIVEGVVINEVFERLNRNSRKLERQELRHARNDGWFIKFVENEPDADDFWTTYRISTTTRARRMRDVQLISELLMVVVEGSISGFDQDALDAVYVKYDAPEETHPDFDAVGAAQRFAQVKQYIRQMDQHNQCVAQHATTSTHFYSLWSCIALMGQRPEPPLAAGRYANLMAVVASLQEQEDIESFYVSMQQDAPFVKEAFAYAVHARGASTEPAQREARHQVLMGVLSGQ